MTNKAGGKKKKGKPAEEKPNEFLKVVEQWEKEKEELVASREEAKARCSEMQEKIRQLESSLSVQAK